MTARSTGVSPPAASAACTAGRAELVRAIGAVALTPPPGCDAVCAALDLPLLSAVEYTEAFVLLAPPHAAIHLGAEGKLGGDALDRVEGFWRALGTAPPRDADHLGTLSMAYAELCAQDSPAALHAARALLHEHLWSWAPGYLTALAASASPPITEWCALTLDVLAAEAAEIGEPVDLPLALRTAPAAVTDDTGLDELLDAMVAPVRSGVVLTQHDVARGADMLGVGFRRGERRFAIKAMIAQDTHATLTWFAGLAADWQDRHVAAYGGHPTGRWWAARAGATAEAVGSLAGRMSS